MDIQLLWHQPLDLYHSDTLIYDILDPGIGAVPGTAGVYVFARVHGKTVAPLYIGRAENMNRRIGQQLNNAKLMMSIRRAPTGARRLYIGEVIKRPKQDPNKAIKTIESALISTAMVEGYDLLNVSGTKTLAHTIISSGSREARAWLPENTIKLRRA